ACSSARASAKSSFGYATCGRVALPWRQLARNPCCTLAGQLARPSRRMPRAARTRRLSRAVWRAMASVIGGSAVRRHRRTVPQWSASRTRGRAAAAPGPPAVGLLRQALGQAFGGAGHFLAQLEVVGDPARIEAAVLDRRAHRAAGLTVVGAVVETALRGQFLDVAEAAVGQLLLAG